MVNILRSRAREATLPGYETLYDRSCTGVTEITVDPNHIEMLHHFNNGVLAHEANYDLTRPVFNRREQCVGMRYSHDFVMENGIDRSASVYVPVEELRSEYPFTIAMDTPWYTGLDGHNDRIAELLMKHLGVTIVLVGPEFSSRKPKNISAEQSLGRIARLSSTISLASAAEASVEILSLLKDEFPGYNINRNIVDVGESRGAMLGEVRHEYARARGFNPVGSEFTDPSASERGLTNFRDVAKTLLWLPKEAIGSMAVAAALHKTGDLHRQVGTVPIDKRMLIGATLGTGPAILSGEEGSFSAYTPLKHGQMFVQAARNGLSGNAQRKENFKNHHNTHWIDLDMCHLGLGFPSVIQHLIERLHSLGSECVRSESTAADIRWSRVHGKHTVNESLPIAS